MAEKLKRVKVLELVQDWDLWPRYEAGKLDSTNLRKLCEVLKAGKPFDTPMVVDAKSMRIVDGFHRAKALLTVKGMDAEADVLLVDYKDDIEMRLAAARFAHSGSLQMTPKDIAHFCLRMRRDRVPWPRIAEALSMDPERCRSMIERRSIDTPDGRAAVAGGAEELVTRLQESGKRPNSDQVHYARHADGSVPRMHAWQLLNAVRAYRTIGFDEKTIAVLKELYAAIGEVLAKVKE